MSDLDLRQLCNVAYAALAENLDADGRRNLDARLAGERVGPRGQRARSTGAADLMRVMSSMPRAR